MNGGRVRDAHRPEPKCLSSTGELIDIERVTISLEGGRWKSTHRGNSLAAYPTACPVRVIPAASGGALEGRSLSCWGNLSPKPPNKDAIPPHRKQWGILASFRETSCREAARRFLRLTS